MPRAEVRLRARLGPPIVPTFKPLLGEGSPTKIDYRKDKYPYSVLSLLEDLDRAHKGSICLRTFFNVPF